MKGLKGDDVANVILRVIAAAQSELTGGAALTVTNRRLALRKFPLLPVSDEDASS